MPKLENLIASRIQHNIPPSPVMKFIDPLTLISLASLVINIFRYCNERNARTQVMQARRRPFGRIASQLQESLAEKYQEKHPSMSQPEVHEYVAATMQSLQTASQAELDELLAEAQDAAPR